MKTHRSLSIVCATALAAGFLLPSGVHAENEIGYIERFALAENREAVLAELVPGSEDYYFFHCLHYQNSGNAAKYAEFMKQWGERYPNENARRRIIENRQALLVYDATPQATLDYLKHHLGVTHHHQQEVRDRKPNLPSVLDPNLVTRDVFQSEALRHDDSLGGLSQSALETLVRNKVAINKQQRRALLSRLQRPDVQNLPELIIADLKSGDSSGFGEFAIHRALLPEQLDVLVAAIPALATNSVYVDTRMRKLAPSLDVDIAFDPVAREAWLERVWDYAKTLPPAFNTYKAHILYQRLDHDRAKGVYDSARFLEYLKLPRGMGYVNPRWLEKRASISEPQCDLNADLSAALLANRPIGNDEPLVREYFLALFDQAAKENPTQLGVQMMAPYTDYIIDSWLKPVLAEALITGGHGTPEQWAALLNPTAFQQLKERVDIEFPATNSPHFQPGEAAEFDVVVKNTPKLIVKIYELNALNFFQTQKRQLNTDLNLDGLVANTEQTHGFDTGPFKRTRKTFKFPELKGKRGAWIIEFIGTGRSSRALVRVGQWQVIQQTGPGGDLLLVVDEKQKPVKDAVVWLDGRKFTRDEKLDRFVIPFTANPGTRPIVVSDPAGGFATLTQFDHHAESYTLDAQFHIEREQLLARRDATLAVRASLLLGEAHLDPALLIEPKLTIASTNLDGISTISEVKDLKLSAGSVLTHTLSVPERLASLTVVLSGKIAELSTGGVKRELSATRSWSLNGIDKTEATNDGHISKFGKDYVFELLGKNGESVADQQIVFIFSHLGFTNQRNIALKTDENGRINLGALPGIIQVQASFPNGRNSSWQLDDSERTWSSDLHVANDAVVRIPRDGGIIPVGAQANDASPQAEISLLEIKADTFTADHAGKLAFKDGFIEITGLAPGDYSLRMRGEDRDFTIKIGEGKTVGGWLLGKSRNLELKNTAPLQITSLAAEDEFVTIKLANTTPFTRVHIAASRFEPGRGIFTGLGAFTRFGVASGFPANQPNLYSAGRQIGDEYRYILERRYGKIYPGNMLTRPGLLLNPWAIRDTDIDQLSLAAMQQAGVTRGGRGERRNGAEMDPMPSNRDGNAGAAGESNLDFLATSAPAIFNLLPDKDGLVRIERKALGDRQHIQVYAEDLTNAAWQSFALGEVPTPFADQRLARNFDHAKPFTQRKEVTVLAKGQTLAIEDILTSEFETYDTLGGIHSLFSTLSNNPTFAQFAWILQWPQLKDEEKLAKYSEFACHELNFFLARKDPAFFEKVVKPALANKKDKTFMDDFLLGRDLGAYLSANAFARLNVVERALLAQRMKGEGASAARHLRELWELLPPNPDWQDQLFETALRGRALEVGGAPGWSGEMKKQKELLKSEAVDQLRSMSETAAAPAASAPPAKPGELRPSLERRLREVDGKLAKGLSLHAAEGEMLADLAANGEDKFFAQEEAKSAKKMAVDRQLALKDDVALGRDELGESIAYFGGETATASRAQVRIYYRQLGPTKEWAENNYYHLRITEQNGSLIPVNAFWRDYAAWVAEGSQGAFISPNVAEASRNFTEMMLALAVLDLPFDAPEHEGKTAAGRFELKAGGPLIAYHKEIKPSNPPADDAQSVPLLVSQSFFLNGDRFRMEGNEKFEKYVTFEFLTGTVYGANIVVTNPTSVPAKSEVLLQIPRGAMPVLGTRSTNSRSVRLEPYTTQTFEYFFYFPATAGKEKFKHFPVTVAVKGQVAGSAKPFEFNVVTKLTQVDKASWDYISQYGTEDEVFAFLGQNNLAALSMQRVAWRCHDAAFFKKLCAFMNQQHIWDPVIFSYALLHNDRDALREWIRHQDGFVAQCGPFLASPLVLLDPVERRAYEHLEYSPLVNQRAHRLGSEHRIANPAVLAQYQALLNILAHKPALDSADHMTVTYYLFLQDRVEDALARFGKVEPKDLPTRLQHDYFRCYAGFYEVNLNEARGIASGYSDYPIERWRLLFANVTTQLDEIEGKEVKVQTGTQPDREKQQSELAATEPGFEFKVENRNINLTYRNLSEVTLNYYLMDPEFSFSSNPFVSEDASRFSIIKPNRSAVQKLPKDKDTLNVPLPGEFAKANVLVEIVATGQRKAQAYHSNTLRLAFSENYGRLEARDSASNAAVSKAYVKVYVRLQDGTVRFFKDGYTDLRGRFDYASLNSSGAAVPMPEPVARSAPAPSNGLDFQMLKPAELSQIEKFSILILSETNGAATREVAPPSE
ncbi:MAG: hypothetical protein ACKO2G_15220 [Verrucomicrobiales bacterium]